MTTSTSAPSVVPGRRRLSAGLWCGLAVLLGFTSTAHSSGYTRSGMTGTMFRQVFLMKAGVSYEFSTRNLSPTSDTILHVLNYPDGHFIAGNDDTTGTDPDTGIQVTQPFSTVGVLSASTDRTVYLVVRGKPGTPAGTADFRILGRAGATVVKDATTHITFSAGLVTNVASLAAGTHITTVEEPIGALDTMVLVVGADPATTLAFDDNDGLDLMSFARLGTSCTANCQIVVGSPTPSVLQSFLGITFPAGPVTLVWDETIEVSNHDPDGDGLSSELEGIIGTDPHRLDTDGDGIGDGFEVYGVQLILGGRTPILNGAGNDGNLLKLPKYGANPTARDVFAEIDWAPACPASDPACCTGASGCPPTSIGVDGKKATIADLTQAFSAMSGAANVHFDAAIPTSPTDVFITFGDWGGANRLRDDQVTFTKNASTGTYVATLPSPLIGDKDCFTGVTPARVGFFHHLVASDGPTKGRIPTLGTTLFESAACALVRTGDGSVPHELGHNFNLRHGGFGNQPDGETNCKLNYDSIMSYVNQVPTFSNPALDAFAPGYSAGQYQSVVLNGTKMDEANGLMNANPAVLAVFNNGRLARGLTNGTGGIDWNMDGVIGSGLVRAPTNWADTTCGAPYLRASWHVSSGRGVALPTLDIASASAASPKMFVAGQIAGTGSIGIGLGQSDVICDPQNIAPCSNWISRVALSTGASGLQPDSGLAVAGPLIVYRTQFGFLVYYRRIGDTWWLGPNGLGATNVTGDPAAIEVNGRVKVYALDSAGQLRRWEYDEATNTWPVTGNAEVFDDGTPAGMPVHSGFGIAVAHGAVRPGGEGVFAAIPNRDRATPNQPMPLEFAQLTTSTTTTTITVPAHLVSIKGGGTVTVPAYTYSFTTTADRWKRLNLSNTPSAQFAKPGLVYAPFDLASPDDGRFYLSWVSGTGFAPKTAQIMFTEGNADPSMGATSRRLLWQTGHATTMFADPDSQTRDLSSGVVLGRFGQSVTAAATDAFGSTFFPAADGIVNGDFRDYPDTLLVQRNLGCSVHGDSCSDSP